MEVVKVDGGVRVGMIENGQNDRKQLGFVH